MKEPGASLQVHQLKTAIIHPAVFFQPGQYYIYGCPHSICLWLHCARWRPIFQVAFPLFIEAFAGGLPATYQFLFGCPLTSIIRVLSRNTMFAGRTCRILIWAAYPLGRLWTLIFFTIARSQKQLVYLSPI